MTGDDASADEACVDQRIADGSAISGQAGFQQGSVGGLGFGCDRPRGPEVEQDQAFAFGLIAIIGEIRISLHHAKFKQLAQDQRDQYGHDPVTCDLRRGLQCFDRLAGQKCHGQHPVGAELWIDVRHDHVIHVGKQFPEPGHLPRFAFIVCFLGQLALGFGKQRGDVEFAREQA